VSEGPASSAGALLATPVSPFWASIQNAQYFGVGFFSGTVQCPAVLSFPIEKSKGQLVAHAGRSIDGSEPKHKLPAGFKKSHVLYHPDVLSAMRRDVYRE